MSETMSVRATFSSDAAMQDAISQLTLVGFDRADLSVAERASSLEASEQASSLPTTETDTRQARTLGTSIAGAVGAFAAAGLTIATGGAAAVAVGAALAAGAGAAGAANLGGTAASRTGSDQRADAATRGELTLTVRVRSPEKVAGARAALTGAGGHDVARVTADAPRVVESSAWTGG